MRDGWRAFLRGVASIFDIAGALGPRMPSWHDAGRTDTERDALAIASDWRAVGDDLRAARAAMERIEPRLTAPRLSGRGKHRMGADDSAYSAIKRNEGANEPCAADASNGTG